MLLGLSLANQECNEASQAFRQLTRKASRFFHKGFIDGILSTKLQRKTFSDIWVVFEHYIILLSDERKENRSRPNKPTMTTVWPPRFTVKISPYCLCHRRNCSVDWLSSKLGPQSQCPFTTGGNLKIWAKDRLLFTTLSMEWFFCCFRPVCLAKQASLS